MQYHLLAIGMLSFAAVAAGCSKPSAVVETPRTPPRRSTGDGAEQFETISQIVASYDSFDLMTPKPVIIDSDLAISCVAVRKKDIDEARLKNGPHTHSTIKIFMNKSASSAFEQNTDYPIGSVIVKEKTLRGFYNAGATKLTERGGAVGGMRKRADGYDRQNGNWEYFYSENKSDIDAGKIPSCVQCHAKAQNSDFVFGNWEKSETTISYGY